MLYTEVAMHVSFLNTNTGLYNFNRKRIDHVEQSMLDIDVNVVCVSEPVEGKTRVITRSYPTGPYENRHGQVRCLGTLPPSPSFPGRGELITRLSKEEALRRLFFLLLFSVSGLGYWVQAIRVCFVSGLGFKV